MKKKIAESTSELWGRATTIMINLSTPNGLQKCVQESQSASSASIILLQAKYHKNGSF